MAKKNKLINKINLRGDSNFETLLNTANALIGSASTLTFVTAGLATNVTEVGLGFAGKAGKEIAKTAKEDGFMATWDSLRSEEAVTAANKAIYALKDKVIGKANQATGTTTKLDDALADLPKAERKAAKAMIKVARAAKIMTGKEIEARLEDGDTLIDVLKDIKTAMDA